MFYNSTILFISNELTRGVLDYVIDRLRGLNFTFLYRGEGELWRHNEEVELYKVGHVTC